MEEAERKGAKMTLVTVQSRSQDSMTMMMRLDIGRERTGARARGRARGHWRALAREFRRVGSGRGSKSQ